MNFKEKIEDIKKITSFRDYYLCNHIKKEYDDNCMNFEIANDDKFKILEKHSDLYGRELFSEEEDLSQLIEYNDKFTLAYLENLNTQLWDFSVSHHKPIGELIYFFSQNLIPIYEDFNSRIKDYVNRVDPGYFFYKMLPYNDYFKKSMEYRLVFFKDFIISLENFSIELKDKINFKLSAKEQEVVDNSKKKNAEDTKTDNRISKSMPTNDQRLKALQLFCPEIFYRLGKITEDKKDIQGMVLYLITGVNAIDCYKKFSNEDYLKKIDDTLIQMYLDKLK
ncbi:MAG: hypothetical protein JWO58_2545 [Chitinophagaceae bacterium]|nr:hypothetical protein [Chitinophagaceae bacterium]